MDFSKKAIKTSVVACILDEQQRVLLTLRSIEPFLGQWVLPGGKIDHGEGMLQALHREVREEVGIEIHIEKLIDVFEHIGVGEQNDHFVILYYRARPHSIELSPNPEECSEAGWFSSSELKKLKLPAGARHVLQTLSLLDN